MPPRDPAPARRRAGPNAAARSAASTAPTLPPEFQWLRTPEPERIFTLTGRALRLHGRESLGSWFEQSLVARRQEHHAYRAETDLDADPRHLATGRRPHHLLQPPQVPRGPRSPTTPTGRVLTLVSCLGDWPGERAHLPAGPPVPLPDGPLRLAVEVDGATQQFLWTAPDGPGRPLGPALDASIISDEGGRGEHASFTGAFVGMVAYDLTGQGWSADVPRFEYHPRA